MSAIDDFVRVLPISQYQSILNLFVQGRADLAQGLWIGDEDKSRKVATVGTEIEFFCQLLCKCGFIILLLR